VTVELAAVILAHNEERHIGDCLDSLAWVDERVVVDDFSTDHTASIARAQGAQAYADQIGADGYASNAAAAAELAKEFVSE